MGIDFSADRWDRVRRTYRQWWHGDLDRPVVTAVIEDRDPGRTKPDVPMLSQATCADLTIPAETIIDRIDYELSRRSFLGDSFPFFSMEHFGPGVIAAFLGGILDNSSGSVWFFPDADRHIADITFRFDPDNVWFRRICDLYTAGMERWQGQVLMGMTDLGGNLDILATFRPGEKLLLDLYDYPDEVKRLTREAHEAWHQYYNALDSLLQPVNPGYSDWSGIYSEGPSYMLQCDFCYMIGPDHFDEFVKPELAASSERLNGAFYHLDGIGQLVHLDSLLTITTILGVQWIPGAGKPDCAHWPEVYRKIQGAGKLIQIIDGFDALNAVRKQLGSARGIHLKNAPGGRREEVRRKLADYGIE